MSLTPEQCRALVDAITVAGSADALEELRRMFEREQGPAVPGGFLELLIDVRHSKLGQPPDRGRVS
jgi:hypothetical protein